MNRVFDRIGWLRRMVAVVVVGLLAAGVFVGSTAPVAPVAAVSKSSSGKVWSQFLKDRPKPYNRLAPPFVDCFQRRDSLIYGASPIFHGCIDWHSAVHAA